MATFLFQPDLKTRLCDIPKPLEPVPPTVFWNSRLRGNLISDRGRVPALRTKVAWFGVVIAYQMSF